MDKKQEYLIRKTNEAIEHKEFSNAVAYYDKARSFGSCDELKSLKTTIDMCRKRVSEEKEFQDIYESAKSLMRQSDKESLNYAIEKFESLSGYKDSEQNIEKAKELLNQLNENESQKNKLIRKWCIISLLSTVFLSVIIVIIVNISRPDIADKNEISIQNKNTENGSTWKSNVKSDDKGTVYSNNSQNTDSSNIESDGIINSNTNTSSKEVGNTKSSVNSSYKDSVNVNNGSQYSSVGSQSNNSGGKTQAGNNETTKTTSSTNASSTSTSCRYGHHWEIVDTKTVHYDEVGHYQTVTHYGNYVNKYKCGKCSALFDTKEQCEAHLEEQNHWNMSYNGTYKYVSSYKLVSVEVPYTTEEWRVDKEAYDIITKTYKCSDCGVEKKEKSTKYY